MKPKALILGLSLATVLLGWCLIVFGKPVSQTAFKKHTLPGASIWNNCENCHQTTSWKKIKPNVNFPHAITGFPLRGRHKQTLCSRCHNTSSSSSAVKRKGKKGTASPRRRGHSPGVKRIRSCNQCHNTPHNQTISRDCQRCHNTRTWKRTRAFAAHQRTHFPLTGAHASVTCGACHIQKEMNKFRKLPTRCFSCHAKAYVATSTPQKHPDHRLAGFSTVCSDCHSTYAWKPVKTSVSLSLPLLASKVKHVLFFPLLGAHQRVQCRKCHVRDRYKGTPKNCSSCHAKSYKRAGHKPANYSTRCLDCHNQTTWRGASFKNHDRSFLISTGKHRGFTCTQCHRTAKKKGRFTCLGSCHTKSKMDTKHIGNRNVNGTYSYESRNCLSCHSSGKQ